MRGLGADMVAECGLAHRQWYALLCSELTGGVDTTLADVMEQIMRHVPTAREHPPYGGTAAGTFSWPKTTIRQPAAAIRRTRIRPPFMIEIPEEGGEE